MNSKILFLMLALFVAGAGSCSKAKESASGSATTTTTADDDDDDGSSSIFSAEVAEIDSALDECTDAAISTCGADDSCLVDAVNACLGTAIPDWADASCEDADFEAAYPDICNGEEVDTCEDTMAEALAATAEETGTDIDCRVGCYCQLIEDYDTEAYESCTATCEEAGQDPEDDEDEENGNPDCISAMDDALADGTIDEGEYYYWLQLEESERGCGVDLFDGWHLEMQNIEDIVDGESSVFDDNAEYVFTNGNDSEGTAEDSEVQSSATDAGNKNTIIAGIALNAYDFHSNGEADKINVECVWLAWREIINGVIQEAKSDTFSYDGDGNNTGSCNEDDEFETGGPDSDIDYRNSNKAIVSLAVDGEDCGIEADVYRKPLLDEYRNNNDGTGTFLGDYVKSPFQLESYGTDDLTWCNKSSSDGYCDDYADKPDNEILDLLDQDAFIVGIGIQATRDGNRCAINIHTQALDVTMTEGDFDGWYAEDEPEENDEPEGY